MLERTSLSSQRKGKPFVVKSSADLDEHGLGLGGFRDEHVEHGSRCLDVLVLRHSTRV